MFYVEHCYPTANTCSTWNILSAQKAIVPRGTLQAADERVRCRSHLQEGSALRRRILRPLMAVLTDASSSGKNIVLRWLAQLYGAGVIRIYSETETNVLRSGVQAVRGSGQFQQLVTRKQIAHARETRALEGTRFMAPDRGELDGVAYLDGSVEELCSLTGRT